MYPVHHTALNYYNDFISFWDYKYQLGEDSRRVSMNDLNNLFAFSRYSSRFSTRLNSRSRTPNPTTPVCSPSPSVVISSKGL